VLGVEKAADQTWFHAFGRDVRQNRSAMPDFFLISAFSCRS